MRRERACKTSPHEAGLVSSEEALQPVTGGQVLLHLLGPGEMVCNRGTEGSSALLQQFSAGPHPTWQQNGALMLQKAPEMLWPGSYRPSPARTCLLSTNMRDLGQIRSGASSGLTAPAACWQQAMRCAICWGHAQYARLGGGTGLGDPLWQMWTAQSNPDEVPK